MSDKFRELFIIYLCRAHYGVIQQVDKLMRKLWGVSYENGVSYLEKRNYTDDNLSKEFKGPRKLIWTMNENLISNRTVLEKVYKSLTKQATSARFQTHMGLTGSLPLPELDFFEDPRVIAVVSNPGVTKEDLEEFRTLKNEVLRSYNLEERNKFRENISRYQIPPNYDMAQLLWDLKRACILSKPYSEKQVPAPAAPVIAANLQPPTNNVNQAPVANLEILLPPIDFKIRCPQPHGR